MKPTDIFFLYSIPRKADGLRNIDGKNRTCFFMSPYLIQAMRKCYVFNNIIYQEYEPTKSSIYTFVYYQFDIYFYVGSFDEPNDYGKKEYFSKKNIFSVRQQYRTRFGLENFAGNYSNDRRFASSEWLCRCKESREEESHLTSGRCTVFGDLKERFGDLHDDENLVQFFHEVLARRD